ncbi:hypothetical protein LIS04_37 [Listeria phage LIS04]|nr:hypothetical protein LIS04_37 [Listeria phage LIS04]
MVPVDDSNRKEMIIMETGKRVGVISDIHGEYDLLVDLLRKINYNPSEWTLIFLGDYVDKGPKSKEVVSLIKKLVEHHECIAIKGNHDYKFVKWMKGNPTAPSGISETIKSYTGTHVDSLIQNKIELAQMRKYINREYSSHIRFLDSLPLYHEDDNHIYVHAGIDLSRVDWQNSHRDKFLFSRKEFYAYPNINDKPVVFGHTECDEIHQSNDPWITDDKVAVDGGAYRDDGQLNCLEIIGKGDYITHSVSKSNVLNKAV